MRKAILLIGLFFFAFSVPLSCDRREANKTLDPQKNNTEVHGPTAKELLYELSERCGKTCAQRYKEEVGKEGVYSDKGEQGARSYNSHYNAKLNKCFILMTDESYGHNGSLLKMLWDINENKEYGNIFLSMDKDSSIFPTRVLGCYVSEKRCNSQIEWDTLVKPYMEE